MNVEIKKKSSSVAYESCTRGCMMLTFVQSVALDGSIVGN